MIDSNDIRYRGSSTLVYFRNLPIGNSSEAIYIENEYHVKMNRFLKLCRWWLQKKVFDKYECGHTELVYLPCLSKKRQRELIRYQFPYMSDKFLRKIPDIKTTDLLDYLDDPDDARFLKPGFLFYKETKDNGLVVYEYYPILTPDCSVIFYKSLIEEILTAHKENVEKYKDTRESVGIGHSGAFYKTAYKKGEDYADNMFQSFDSQTQAKLQLFKRQIEELKQSGVPMAMLEQILRGDVKLSKLVITRKHEIILPDYNNMVIKMEPLVKAVFLLFLKHPEGIIFKHLPDYKQELIDIYNELRPQGLTMRSMQSIEDVTDPFQNSINEKCARIRAAFVDKFDIYLAKNYIITGERGEAKKITLPRDLVIWEK